MKLADVIVDVASACLESTYTYRVNDTSEQGDDPLEVGCVVMVPLGARSVLGFVARVYTADTCACPVKRLRSIQRVCSQPYFTQLQLQCAYYMARYYIAPLSACIRLFMPPGGVGKVVRAPHGEPVAGGAPTPVPVAGGTPVVPGEECVVDGARDGASVLATPPVLSIDTTLPSAPAPAPSRAWIYRGPVMHAQQDTWLEITPEGAAYAPPRNAHRQSALLDALRAGPLLLSELALQFDRATSTVNSLVKKGFITKTVQAHSYALSNVNQPHYTRSFQLNEHQHAAISCITQCMDSACGQAVVVDGVTGSGKTEVYLEAIAHCLQAGKNAIVLVPEISLTPQTVARFRGRFGNMVALLHSRLTTKERFEQWQSIYQHHARVVVGARSALFCPLRDIGLIIIDEEHVETYKQEAAPRYHARDVAWWMAQQTAATLVLGSATPSLETLEAVKRENWHHVKLATRANGAPMPPITVVDMAAEFGGGSRSMFSRTLQQALVHTLQHNHKAVLMLNQRGFARFVLCRDCGYTPECTHCSTKLTFHEVNHRLMCHHCGYSAPLPAVCPVCKSPYLKKFGAGTQRVEAELRSFLSQQIELTYEVPVVRMDADTTSARYAHERLLDEFASFETGAVLLGTQMIAKGLDFKDVTLVGIINADTTLNLPDYRSHERTFNLIEQVAGRAGRDVLPGRVILQTYNPHVLPIQAAAHYDRSAFITGELEKRRQFGYPPFTSCVNILAWGAQKEATRHALEQFRVVLMDHLASKGCTTWWVSDVLACVLEKVREIYRFHIFIKAPREAAVSAVLYELVRKRKTVAGVNIAIDVDPLSVM